MTPEPTNVTVESVARAYNLSPLSADRLLCDGEWVFDTLAAIASDRYGLKEVGDDLFEDESGALVRLVVIIGELNLAPKGMKSRRCFKPDLFVEYYTTRVVGVIIATVEDFWFVPSKDIIEWHEIGTLQYGAMKRDKALRLLAFMPDEES